MHAGYGCFLQTYIVGIFKSADIKNWWHKKTALQDLFRPFFRIGLAFLGEKLCRLFKPQNAWNTLYENLIIFACSFCFYNIRELNSLYRNSHPLGRNYFETELKVEDLSGGLYRRLTGLKWHEIIKIVVHLLSF